MAHYKYLIAGAGMAGDAAVRGIRELDPQGTVGLLGAEPDAPYTRPALSKGLWKGRPLEKIWRGTQTLNADLLPGRIVRQLDPKKKQVWDHEGNKYTFEKLLIATGGRPNHLPFGDDEIIYYRDLQDYRRLRDLADRHERFAVIGGSFVGSELAAALAMNGKKVTVLIRGSALCADIFPQDVANFLNEYYRQKGVELVPGDPADGMEKTGGGYLLHTKSGRKLEVGGVVAGIGIQPNVQLAKDAGLDTEDGVVVDEQLRTSHPDIYAAGDVARFYHAGLGKQTRVEHEDNALRMGKLAGRNMAGAQETYQHIPMFYSDLFDLGYEAVGELSSKLETVADWQEPFQKGVIYYLDQGRVRGVLLWNVWKKVDEARALLREPGPFREQDLRGRITG